MLSIIQKSRLLLRSLRRKLTFRYVLKASKGAAKTKQDYEMKEMRSLTVPRPYE